MNDTQEAPGVVITVKNVDPDVRERARVAVRHLGFPTLPAYLRFKIHEAASQGD